ncbi:hypothetical protein CHU98_g6482 [Xylaria longipes]|nr:hypothetical protein CHU98_g6482 [Xylaria longipes]
MSAVGLAAVAGRLIVALCVRSIVTNSMASEDGFTEHANSNDDKSGQFSSRSILAPAWIGALTSAALPADAAFCSGVQKNVSGMNET